MLLFLHSLSHLLVDAACAATLFGPVRELGDLSSLLLLYNTLAFSAQCLAGLAADRLRRLNRRARGRIVILPGGGVTPANAAPILARTGCTEIHASASETVNGNKVTSAEKVAAILRSL